jgi:soluble lytic murein transglycosylase-like protein
MMRFVGASKLALIGFSLALFSGLVFAGNQQYEPMTAAMQSALAAAIADTMSAKLPRRHKPEYQQRMEFLRTVRYEAQRAGLEPELVLGLIEVESYFRRYAISSAGARGYMQVMPFWTKVIGDGDTGKLFDMRSNIRYGCTILWHYVDIERGDLFRALGRYNGSLGKAEYPNLILRAWKKYDPKVENK